MRCGIRAEPSMARQPLMEAPGAVERKYRSECGGIKVGKGVPMASNLIKDFKDNILLKKPNFYFHFLDFLSSNRFSISHTNFSIPLRNPTEKKTQLSLHTSD
ncbi:hypothetical protein L1987_02954 [Smallanthus sonchifolius]|uniref:Uncharacterized protein n=1 Tax=Smallanthus sonchifolius TaxID=185202 RepID=A0ACB9K9C7_9ASTR|nr:hypothetical protein L1987_02954 [Smallanthus sonchifolius]